MKTEKWNNHNIRFVEKDSEWWAVAKDVAEALGYKHTPHMIRNLDAEDKDVHKVDSTYVDMVSTHNVTSRARNSQEMTIISEFGIYDAVFRSNKKEAKDFKKWIFEVIKELRTKSGLAGFEVFRLLDKEHQKEMMSNLSRSLSNPVRINFIKANTITNKAVSSKYGYEKMLKKGEMTPEMLISRQPVLNDTVELMSINDKFGLGLSVAKVIYGKYN